MEDHKKVGKTNRFKNGYDFKKLTKALPALTPFVAKAHGRETIDFSNPEAVFLLNKALMVEAYGLQSWELPTGYLCPGVPGRADYIHAVAAILPKKEPIRVLDIGTGANLVYPIIGFYEYGWHFVGTDVDEKALNSAKAIIKANQLTEIQLRKQSNSENILDGIIEKGEFFDLSICNPPFHESAAAAQQSNQRKRKNLGKPANHKHKLNFGGQAGELWFEGGERKFVGLYIKESKKYAEQIGIFSTLVSKKDNLPLFQDWLKKTGAAEIRTLDLALGNKKTRVLCWRF